jgi:hypothetical protein
VGGDLVRDEGVAGSNPATPTSFLDWSLHRPDRNPDRYSGTTKAIVLAPRDRTLSTRPGKL